MAVVLIVNDDRDLLDMYAEALRAMGHEPVTKEAIDSGPETVRQVGADALLVDLQAPQDDKFGLRVIQEVRHDPEMRDLPIILATGATDDLATLHQQLEALRVPVLIKPFGISVLEERLQAVLAKPD
jgi:DNA-binding response OmpR family regulator